MLLVMLSTFHDDTFIEKRRRTRLAADGVEVIHKPSVVEDYNQHMGGVDKGKQCNECTLKKSYHLFSFSRGFAHRSIKWWKRVFFHVLDTAIVNAHILYKTVSVPNTNRFLRAN